MTPEEHRGNALRLIAARVMEARGRTGAMGLLPSGEGEALMCDLEAILMGLVVHGAVPGPTDPRHDPLRGLREPEPRALE